jgi:hypothetical protein
LAVSKVPLVKAPTVLETVEVTGVSRPATVPVAVPVAVALAAVAVAPALTDAGVAVAPAVFTTLLTSPVTGVSKPPAVPVAVPSGHAADQIGHRGQRSATRRARQQIGVDQRRIATAQNLVIGHRDIEQLVRQAAARRGDIGHRHIGHAVHIGRGHLARGQHIGAGQRALRLGGRQHAQADRAGGAVRRAGHALIAQIDRHHIAHRLLHPVEQQRLAIAGVDQHLPRIAQHPCHRAGDRPGERHRAGQRGGGAINAAGQTQRGIARRDQRGPGLRQHGLHIAGGGGLRPTGAACAACSTGVARTAGAGAGSACAASGTGAAARSVTACASASWRSDGAIGQMGISGAGTQAEQHAAGHRGGHQKAAICNHDILLAWGGPGMVRSLGPLSGPVHGVMGWCKEAPDHVPIQKGKSPRDRQFQASFPIVMTLTILFRYSKNTSCNCHFIYFKNGTYPVC